MNEPNMTLSNFEASVMPTQVQESSYILFNTHNLHQRGLDPCAIFELQFQPHPNLLDVLLL